MKILKTQFRSDVAESASGALTYEVLIKRTVECVVRISLAFSKT